MEQQARFQAYRRLRNRRILATWATMAVLLLFLAGRAGLEPLGPGRSGHWHRRRILLLYLVRLALP